MKQPVPFFYKPRYRKHQSAILVPKKEWHLLFHDGKFRDVLRWMLIHCPPANGSYVPHSSSEDDRQRVSTLLPPNRNNYHKPCPPDNFANDMPVLPLLHILVCVDTPPNKDLRMLLYQSFPDHNVSHQLQTTDYPVGKSSAKKLR